MERSLGAHHAINTTSHLAGMVSTVQWSRWGSRSSGFWEGVWHGQSVNQTPFLCGATEQNPISHTFLLPVAGNSRLQITPGKRPVEDLASHLLPGEGLSWTPIALLLVAEVWLLQWARRLGTVGKTAGGHTVFCGCQTEGTWFLQPSECLESPGEGVKLNERFSAKPACLGRWGFQPPHNTWLNLGVCQRNRAHLHSPHHLLKASSREKTLSQPGKTLGCSTSCVEPQLAAEAACTSCTAWLAPAWPSTTVLWEEQQPAPCPQRSAERPCMPGLTGWEPPEDGTSFPLGLPQATEHLLLEQEERWGRIYQHPVFLSLPAFSSLWLWCMTQSLGPDFQCSCCSSPEQRPPFSPPGRAAV